MKVIFSYKKYIYVIRKSYRRMARTRGRGKMLNFSFRASPVFIIEKHGPRPNIAFAQKV